MSELGADKAEGNADNSQISEDIKAKIRANWFMGAIKE